MRKLLNVGVALIWNFFKSTSACLLSRPPIVYSSREALQEDPLSCPMFKQPNGGTKVSGRLKFGASKVRLKSGYGRQLEQLRRREDEKEPEKSQRKSQTGPKKKPEKSQRKSQREAERVLLLPRESPTALSTLCLTATCTNYSDSNSEIATLSRARRSQATD